MMINLTKIILISCIISCFASAQKVGESAELDYYRHGNARGLYYAEILIRDANEHNRLIYEKDFSARVFNYWLLLQKNLIERDRLVEARFKKALISKTIRKKIWHDPLGRNQKNGHIAASVTFAVTSENYTALVKDFLNYLGKIENDDAVPKLGDLE